MKIVDIKDFCEKVAEDIIAALGDEYKDCTATVAVVQKTNGVCLHGVNIRCSGSNVSPTIYLDEFFKNYKDSEEDLYPRILERIKEIYVENQIVKEIDVSYLSCFENVKDQVCFKTVNASLNKELLSGVPHRLFEDLAVMYYINVSDSTMGEGRIQIKNCMLSDWGIDEETLYTSALTNAKNSGYEITRIGQVLNSLVGYDIEESHAFAPMWVISTKDKTWGAAAILDKETLKKVRGKIGSAFYLLPCSIHELIALSVDEVDDICNLRQIVMEINRTQLAPDIVLSDNVYLYKGGKVVALFDQDGNLKQNDILAKGDESVAV